MAVTVRERKLAGGGVHWQADIRVRLPDGRRHRERVKAPGRTRAAALRWARAREAHILRHGVGGASRAGARDAVPTLERFASRFLQEYVVADRLKPATREGWERVLALYLLPQLGRRRLDEIGALDVQRLKRLPLAASTVNLVLAKLKALLRKAVEWGVIDTALAIKPLPTRARVPDFYDFDAYERLLAAAAELEPWALVVVRLGGDAGLRVGEMLALRWRHLDLQRGTLTVVENEWRGHTGDPKGGATRTIPMTRGLVSALQGLSRRGGRVLDQGAAMYARKIDRVLYRAQRRAGLSPQGPHILRHTFCSHLAMRGAPPRTIQSLAGHRNSATTDRYLHLAPRALSSAIDLLDR